MADHSPPPSAKIESSWGYNATPTLPHVLMASCLVKYRIILSCLKVKFVRQIAMFFVTYILALFVYFLSSHSNLSFY
jgi:hypothetical protein